MHPQNPTLLQTLAKQQRSKAEQSILAEALEGFQLRQAHEADAESPTQGTRWTSQATRESKPSPPPDSRRSLRC